MRPTLSFRFWVKAFVIDFYVKIFITWRGIFGQELRAVVFKSCLKLLIKSYLSFFLSFESLSNLQFLFFELLHINQGFSQSCAGIFLSPSSFFYSENPNINALNMLILALARDFFLKDF